MRTNQEFEVFLGGKLVAREGFWKTQPIVVDKRGCSIPMACFA
jgi:hypothetical protein